jgi:hypothetical protein
MTAVQYIASSFASSLALQLAVATCLLLAVYLPSVRVKYPQLMKLAVSSLLGRVQHLLSPAVKVPGSEIMGRDVRAVHEGPHQ